MSKPRELQWRDYYDLMHIGFGAEPLIIERAYKALASKYHPDIKGTGDESRFKLINEAYEVLSNPSLRSLYDVAYRERRGDTRRRETARLGQRLKAEEEKRKSIERELQDLEEIWELRATGADLKYVTFLTDGGYG